jgi:hypothetical protein
VFAHIAYEILCTGLDQTVYFLTLACSALRHSAALVVSVAS